MDNAPTDGSAETMVSEFPHVKLIRSDRNLGFAGGNKVARRRATGEYLLLLNPDTVVLDDAIGNSWRLGGDPGCAGIWCGRTVFSDGWHRSG
jgi:GT2 family glycosyltransferase